MDYPRCKNIAPFGALCRTFRCATISPLSVSRRGRMSTPWPDHAAGRENLRAARGVSRSLGPCTQTLHPTLDECCQSIATGRLGAERRTIAPAPKPPISSHFRYADERTRTSTRFPGHGPEPCASTNSATSARRGEDSAHATPRQDLYRRQPPRRDGPSATPPQCSTLLASGRLFRAAIVQGTRTPPSHGGNRGSNPRSGTPRSASGRSSVVIA